MGFLQQIHSSTKSVPMLLCNCLQRGMILDWTRLQSTSKEVISKKEPELRNILHFTACQMSIWARLFSKYLVFLSSQRFQHPSWWGSCASVLFCFILTPSKLVDTVLGNEKWQCLTPLCGMWQQEPASASREADSLSETALVVRSLLDKWGFVWILQYSHCSGPKERCNISGTLTHCNCGYRDHSLLCSVIQPLCTQPKIALLFFFFSAGLLQCHLLYNLLPTVISHALSASPVSCGLTQWKIMFSK